LFCIRQGRSVTGCCKHRNEPSVPLKSGNVLSVWMTTSLCGRTSLYGVVQPVSANSFGPVESHSRYKCM
jgi:hypothetical protein